ncbi:preprotein translocase subunit D [Candidatus Scalindua japonica]|uniref:Multifunctional fusion protein n=1 Tax=Candidatus Scalindua japonica TaxID=1284222 RepID=A0A286TV67_9BACT|nr:protein translocase subunit SecD [Candidatus Scalindua japonica]GAX59766.1 preprotein translocase subunit D [Candidatus Scalindua japonica]
MPTNLRWKIPLIVVLIAIAIMALYPVADKPIKSENITEINGKIVDRTIIDDSFFGFLFKSPIQKETIVKKETNEKGETVVHKKVDYIAKGQIKLGLDLRGGSELLYKIKVDESEKRSGLTDEIIALLEKRIDPQGVLEYRLQQQGMRRILIQVPGATQSDIESLKKRITRLGKLEFRLAAPPNSSEVSDAKAGKAVPGYYKHWIRKKKGEESDTEDWFLVRNKIEITGEHLTRVFPDRKDISPVIGFEFDQAGRSKFGRLTERNIGKPLAIILDGTLYSAPIIRDRIPGKGIIEGNFTQEEVNDMIAVMRAGSLPADLELEMETTVGPSLGKDSIRSGLLAGIIGGIFIIIFMCAYYYGAGGVANATFILNIFFVVGTLAVLNATLTLPGIAGLVLMIGMAVDANVLIFERIREEKTKGKTIRLAVKNGYERAFTTIVDSNLTTLITALILYAVGTGPVKGFAIVLIAGLLINMFTAVFVTRVIFEIFLGAGIMNNFSMMQFFKNPKTSFVCFRRIAMIASLVLIVIGLSVFVIRGKDNYDIDFTGGTLIQLKLNKPTPVSDIRNKLEVAGYPNAEVQNIWASKDATTASNDSTEFGIRIKSLNKNKSVQKISDDIQNVVDKKIFKNINYIEPSSYHLTLSNPVDEFVIQDYITKAGYGSDDVLSIYPVEKSGKKYSIRISGLTQENTRTDIINNVTDTFTDLVDMLSIKPLYGDIEDELPNIANDVRSTQFRAISTMGLDLKKAVDPNVLQIALKRAGHKDIVVSARESSRRRDTFRKLQIAGPRDVLEAIKLTASSLNVPPIMIVDNSSIQIELKDSIDEETLRKRLQGSSQLKNNFGEITGMDITANEFMIDVKELNAAKIQEKIREDLFVTFEDRIYSQANESEVSKPDPFKRVVSIGSTVAGEMKSRAALALFFACIAIIIYIWFRFGELKFGVSAVITLVHDVVITVGAVAVADHFGNVFGDVKINLPMIAAFLTLIGYSLNDTIVLFDRIRENLSGKNKTITSDLVNSSINQNLNRTILTSLTTFGVVSALFFVGGAAIHGFAFVMMVGVVVGTYSSIFIASPILLDWNIVKKVFRIIAIIIFFPFWIGYKLLHKTPEASVAVTAHSTQRGQATPKVPAPKGPKKAKGPKGKRNKPSKAQ